MKQLGMMVFVVAVIAGLTARVETQANAQPPGDHHEHFARCAKACADCQVSCDSCFHHCATKVERFFK